MRDSPGLPDEPSAGERVPRDEGSAVERASRGEPSGVERSASGEPSFAERAPTEEPPAVEPIPLSIRLMWDPCLQYRILLAVALPVAAVVYLLGHLTPRDLLETVAFIVLGPPVFHRFMMRWRRETGWHSGSLRGQRENAAWRVGLADVDPVSGPPLPPGVSLRAGLFLDAPENLDPVIHYSFDRIDAGDGWEVWRSEKLRAVIRRDGLHLRYWTADEDVPDEVLERLSRTPIRSGSPQVGPGEEGEA